MEEINQKNLNKYKNCPNCRVQYSKADSGYSIYVWCPVCRHSYEGNDYNYPLDEITDLDAKFDETFAWYSAQEKKLIPIQGKEVYLEHGYGYRFFLHENVNGPHGYGVTEVLSGALIAKADTQREAIEKAEKLLQKIDRQLFVTSIESLIATQEKKLDPEEKKARDLSEKIKEGMQKAKESGVHVGRPPEQEDRESFLQKPKSQEIAVLLKKGLSLRAIRKETGCSVNTIRKVKSMLDAGIGVATGVLDWHIIV